MIPSIKDAEVAGKRVLVHTDFDVPLKDGMVADDTRIKAALPTLNLLSEKNAASIVIISKLGRPGGRAVEALRMAPVRARLAELIDTARIEVKENLRFDPREEKNDDSFAQELAKLGDIFVNEAFADSHRPHASIVGIPNYLPSYAGLHFELEVEKLSESLMPPPHSVAIIGGAKFETKEPLLQKLLTRFEAVFLGGALGNNLLKSRGLPVGTSLTADLGVPTVLASDMRLMQPRDVAVVSEHGARYTNTADVRLQERIVDIGPKTAKEWSDKISHAPFVLWNGPLGMYEAGYTHGTDALAHALAGGSARAVVGGGDTVAALKKFSFDEERVFLSTAGGAMLQFLIEGTLPGIEALKK
jgi:phosphoglycerate kinase